MAKNKKDLQQEIRRVARETFRFERLRPRQEETVLSVLERRDTLTIMASGAGKSAIYQIAGLLTDGPTVVISPLIALQQDQSKSIEEAAVVNSNVRSSVVRETFRDLKRGGVEFLFWPPSSSTMNRPSPA